MCHRFTLKGRIAYMAEKTFRTEAKQTETLASLATRVEESAARVKSLDAEHKSAAEATAKILNMLREAEARHALLVREMNERAAASVK